MFFSNKIPNMSNKILKLLIVNNLKIIPDTQFGFKDKKNPSLQKVHQIVNLAQSPVKKNNIVQV